MQLAPCPRCSRHVEVDERACPFCGAPPPARPYVPQLVGRLGRAAVFSALAGCHPSSTAPQPAAVPPREIASDAGVARFATPPPAADASVAAADASVAPAGVAELRVVVIHSDTGEPYRTRVSLRALPWTSKGLHRKQMSDLDGEVVFTALPPGNYALEVEQPQSNNPRYNRAPPVRRTITLVDGARERIDITVEPYPYVQRGPGPMPYGAPPARRRVV